MNDEIELWMWSQISYDPHSHECNFSNCVRRPEKFRSSTGLEPVTSRYRCDALRHCLHDTGMTLILE